MYPSRPRRRSERATGPSWLEPDASSIISEGSRCDAGQTQQTTGGSSALSKTSAPRYTNPCLASIAATQDRDTRLDTVQLPDTPVNRTSVRAPGRSRVDVSTSAPPADRFTSATSRPGRSRSCRSQDSSVRCRRMVRRRSGDAPCATAPSTIWSRVETPARECVPWLRAHAPRTAVPSDYVERWCRWSRYRAR